MEQINIRDFTRTVQAYQNCVKNGNKEWEEKHLDILDKFISLFPSGSGIDNGVKFYPLDKENKDVGKQFVLHAPFHHMDENGYYDGWTDHKIIYYADMTVGFNLKITERNKNDIKDYLMSVFSNIFYMEGDVPHFVS